MSDIRHILWLIPALPLLAAVVTAFFGPRYLRKNAHWPCVLGVGGACLVSFLVLFAVIREDKPLLWGSLPPPSAQAGLKVMEANVAKPIVVHQYTWFRAGNMDVGFTLRADGLTAIMLVTVTFVGSLIAIFAIGYMSHEREREAGYSRFFAAVALFIFSMTGLVLADNFILLYACWEGVGVCSYLLIGFWFQKPSAAAAARKAFLVTRMGDVGLFLGILLLWAGQLSTRPASGDNPMVGLTSSFWQTATSLDYDTAFAWVNQYHGSAFMAAVALLLFCGAVGKSAQFPLYVWLPDAMEGPTPVSALIHAATMVTAGVYLVARSMPIFHAAPPFALLIVACIGAFTALFAALIALTQTDLKRVLAYSTISQLGYMFLALGSASTGKLVIVAVVAAIFHLFTHAFFKALLFLAAGSVMHAMGNVIDMRRFSGLRKVLPTTHWTFLCGAMALAGVPLLSGFWSKDEILDVAFEASHGVYGNVYMVLFLAGLITAGLTAFYTFRAYFLTFWGEVRIPEEAGHHAHESPPVMTIPLQILAVFAVGVGFIVAVTHVFDHILESHWLEFAFAGKDLGEPEHGSNLILMLGSSVVALGGVALSYVMYVRSPGSADRLAKGMQGLYQLSLNKFHVDELYYAFVVHPVMAIAEGCRIFDIYVVDSLVDLFGQVPARLGAVLRPIQNGLVQFYALAMVLGLALIFTALVIQMGR